MIVEYIGTELLPSGTRKLCVSLGREHVFCLYFRSNILADPRWQAWRLRYPEVMVVIGNEQKYETLKIKKRS